MSGVFFYFPKNVKFLAKNEYFTTATIGPPNFWKNTEVEPSALRTFDYSLARGDKLKDLILPMGMENPSPLLDEDFQFYVLFLRNP